MESRKSIEAIGKTLLDSVPQTDGSKRFKVESNIFINVEPQPPDEECSNGLKEDVTLEFLYSNDNIT